MTSLDNLRREYTGKPLTKSGMNPDPIAQFRLWFDEAMRANVPESNAVVLATASADGVPSARVVLLKEFDEHGFVFYTNYASRKGREIRENPKASLLWYWPSLERQVRATGSLEKVSHEDSAAYFATRPRDSQLAAWASAQSDPVDSREQLEESFQNAAKRFQGRSVPLPDYWGGFRLMPDGFEFWQGRQSRMHDRIAYEKNASAWIIRRLAP